MASTVWKGHLTFGLISIPIKLHRAARAERVSFRQLHGSTASRVKQVYVREEMEPVEEVEPEEGFPSYGRAAPAPDRAAFTSRPDASTVARPEPVPIRKSAPIAPLPPGPAPAPIVDRSELVKGYEYEKGRYVTVSKADLEKITPETASEMQILELVKLAEIDPVYFETSYYVTPERAGERAYALLLEALRKSGYVAIAQFAMHNREHIVVIRPGSAGIVLHTMFYDTEVRREDEYKTDVSGIPERELDLALLLIENLAAPFDPSKYRDTYKEKLDALIAAKIAGEETVEPVTPKSKQPTDILAALERSLALTRKPAGSESKPAAAKKRKTK
jgi:DNA end-binding protein Ku